MKSRQEILGTTKLAQAERILLDLANVPDLPPVGTPIVRGKTDQHTAWVKKMQKLYPQTFGNCSVADMFALRHLLRLAWDAPDLRVREWFCFLLRKFHAEIEQLAESFRQDAGEKLVRDMQTKMQTNKDQLEYWKKAQKPLAQMIRNLADSELVAAYKGADPPALNEFEGAASHLQRNLNHALHCPNPTCAMPYFFSHEKGRRYCSDTCSQYGQRESKRKWWKENRGKSRR